MTARSAADLKPWPTCPTCEEPYVVTIGLPVIISRADAAGRFVEVDVDVADAGSLDADSPVSCGCGIMTEDQEPPEELAAILDSLRTLAPVAAVYDRADVA